jgi:nitrate/nitrite-specific signal transduction histidine kinase
MDDLELLAIPDTDSEPILNRLSYVGTEIRKHLDVNPTDELTLQPELRQGLTSAIEQHLQQLTDSGILQLKVVTNLQPIKEPLLNSKWIDAREDIFRFFREAMTNVVRHAQGENSTSTQVIVSLSQEAEQCTLIIENDGGVVNTASKSRKKGGMGTKLMAEMAASLPDGVWESVALPDGGMRVKLLWTQRF